MICSSSISRASKYEPNESSHIETTQNSLFFKKDTLFTSYGRKDSSEKSWSKTRILQPAKSTPSLLHINDETAIGTSEVRSSPRNELEKL